MQASVLEKQRFVIQNIEKPVLVDKGAIIRVMGCGLCGSDIVKYTHDLVADGAD